MDLTWITSFLNVTHVTVSDLAGKCPDKLSQRWIVRNEQGNWLDLLHEMLQHSIRNGLSVVCARASSQLIQDDQRFRRCVFHDIRCFVQLHHERTFASHHVIRRSHTSIHCIQDAQGSWLCRNIGSDLPHDRYQCNLTDVRAFAAHIGTCQDHGFLWSAKVYIVWHVCAG